MSMHVDAVFSPQLDAPAWRPLFLGYVPAGFPSPAEDYLEEQLDLNQHLVKRPAATFFVRVSGESMIGAGIFPDDILVVDRSIRPVDKKVVVAVINGEMTVKRLRKKGGRIWLAPENDNFEPISVDEGADFHVWGVVTTVIHKV